MLNAIDVSHWQGDIDWSKVRASGVEAAILKSGGSDSGFYRDSKFDAYYAGAKAAGLQVGAYYFVGKGCTSTDDGVADAQRFLEQLSGRQFELPVYMDFEAPTAATKAGNTNAVIGFCTTLERSGYYAGVYASDVAGFRERLQLNRLENRFALWVARYGSAPQVVHSYGAWQHTSSGHINGIESTRVDLDYIYIDYSSIIKSKGLNGFGSSKSALGISGRKYITKALIKKVIRGDYGNGQERIQRLTEAGYDAAEVQKRVNDALK